MTTFSPCSPKTWRLNPLSGFQTGFQEAPQGPPKGNEAGLAPGSPAGPCFIHRVPSGILSEIARSAAKLFSFFFFKNLPFGNNSRLQKLQEQE